jgi:hypothetical protein
MKIALIVIGVLFVLVGGVWILQGAGVLTRGAMAGHSQWTRWGAALAAAGIVVIVVGATRRRVRRV